MFVLSKWYLDLVTGEGTALVAYSARLRWGPVRVAYAATLLAPARAPAVEATSLRPGGRPAVVPGSIPAAVRWSHRGLALAGEWRSEGPAIEATLLDLPVGRIRWHCLAPRATARIECRGQVLTGRGYVELLELSIPPRRLPFRTLRWGRHGSDRHAVVWIEWDGPTPRRWVWLDGLLRSEATLDPAGLDLGPGLRLELEQGRELRDRAVARAVTTLVPGLGRRLAPLTGMRERKRLSRSRLVGEDGPLDDGWTIHEEVTW